MVHLILYNIKIFRNFFCTIIFSSFSNVLYSTNEVFPFIIFCFHPNTEPFETSEVQYIVNFRHVSRNSKRIYQTVKKNFVSEKERKDDFLRNTFCGSLPPRIFLKTQPLFSPTDKLVLQQGVSEIFAVHIWARGNPCLIYLLNTSSTKDNFLKVALAFALLFCQWYC